MRNLQRMATVASAYKVIDIINTYKFSGGLTLAALIKEKLAANTMDFMVDGWLAVTLHIGNNGIIKASFSGKSSWLQGWLPKGQPKAGQELVGQEIYMEQDEKQEVYPYVNSFYQDAGVRHTIKIGGKAQKKLFPYQAQGIALSQCSDNGVTGVYMGTGTGKSEFIGALLNLFGCSICIVPDGQLANDMKNRFSSVVDNSMIVVNLTAERDFIIKIREFRAAQGNSAIIITHQQLTAYCQTDGIGQLHDQVILIDEAHSFTETQSNFNILEAIKKNNPVFVFTATPSAALDKVVGAPKITVPFSERVNLKFSREADSVLVRQPSSLPAYIPGLSIIQQALWKVVSGVAGNTGLVVIPPESLYLMSTNIIRLQPKNDIDSFNLKTELAKNPLCTPDIKRGLIEKCLDTNILPTWLNKMMVFLDEFEEYYNFHKNVFGQPTPNDSILDFPCSNIRWLHNKLMCTVAILTPVHNSRYQDFLRQTKLLLQSVIKEAGLNPAEYNDLVESKLRQLKDTSPLTPTGFDFSRAYLVMFTDALTSTFICYLKGDLTYNQLNASKIAEEHPNGFIIPAMTLDQCQRFFTYRMDNQGGLPKEWVDLVSDFFVNKVAPLLLGLDGRVSAMEIHTLIRVTLHNEPGFVAKLLALQIQVYNNKAIKSYKDKEVYYRKPDRSVNPEYLRNAVTISLSAVAGRKGELHIIEPEYIDTPYKLSALHNVTWSYLSQDERNKDALLALDNSITTGTEEVTLPDIPEAALRQIIMAEQALANLEAGIIDSIVQPLHKLFIKLRDKGPKSSLKMLMAKITCLYDELNASYYRAVAFNAFYHGLVPFLFNNSFTKGVNDKNLLQVLSVVSDALSQMNNPDTAFQAAGRAVRDNYLRAMLMQTIPDTKGMLYNDLSAMYRNDFYNFYSKQRHAFEETVIQNIASFYMSQCSLFSSTLYHFDYAGDTIAEHQYAIFKSIDFIHRVYGFDIKKVVELLPQAIRNIQVTLRNKITKAENPIATGTSLAVEGMWYGSNVTGFGGFANNRHDKRIMSQQLLAQAENNPDPEQKERMTLLGLAYQVAADYQAYSVGDIVYYSKTYYLILQLLLAEVSGQQQQHLSQANMVNLLELSKYFLELAGLVARPTILWEKLPLFDRDNMIGFLQTLSKEIAEECKKDGDNARFSDVFYRSVQSQFGGDSKQGAECLSMVVNITNIAVASYQKQFAEVVQITNAIHPKALQGTEIFKAHIVHRALIVMCGMKQDAASLNAMYYTLYERRGKYEDIFKGMGIGLFQAKLINEILELILNNSLSDPNKLLNLYHTLSKILNCWQTPKQIQHAFTYIFDGEVRQKVDLAGLASQKAFEFYQEHILLLLTCYAETGIRQLLNSSVSISVTKLNDILQQFTNDNALNIHQLLQELININLLFAYTMLYQPIRREKPGAKAVEGFDHLVNIAPDAIGKLNTIREQIKGMIYPVKLQRNNGLVEFNLYISLTLSTLQLGVRETCDINLGAPPALQNNDRYIGDLTNTIDEKNIYAYLMLMRIGVQAYIPAINVQINIRQLQRIINEYLEPLARELEGPKPTLYTRTVNWVWGGNKVADIAAFPSPQPELTTYAIELATSLKNPGYVYDPKYVSVVEQIFSPRLNSEYMSFLS